MHNSIVADKCKFYMQYIVDNNLEDKLFDPNKKMSYNLDTYLYMYFLFQKSGVSYNIFYEILIFGTIFKDTDYPKKSSLNTFKSKLANLNIHHLIHNDHIETNDLITYELLLDSVTIFNKCNSSNTGNFTYKNKKAIKVSHITNNSSYPLFASIDPGNMNDALIGHALLQNNILPIKEKNVIVFADKGYDTNNIRDLLIDNNCSSYIPKNIRNANSEEIKIIKKHEIELAQTKRTELMKKQKDIRKQINLNKNKIKTIRKKKKNPNSDRNNINKIKLKNLNKIIKEHNIQIEIIKKERKDIPIRIKEKIKIEKDKEKDKNDKNECICTDKPNMRECIFCKTNRMCNKCNICKKCKKSLKYYNGLTDEQINKYRLRIRVEHFMSYYKHGRTIDVKDKNRKMLLDTVYNRYTDFIIMRKRSM
jgi:hypothetical protein